MCAGHNYESLAGSPSIFSLGPGAMVPETRHGQRFMTGMPFRFVFDNVSCLSPPKYAVCAQPSSIDTSHLAIRLQQFCCPLFCQLQKGSYIYGKDNILISYCALTPTHTPVRTSKQARRGARAPPPWRTNTIERPIPTVPGAACAWFRTSHGRTAVWTVLPADAHSHTRAEVEEGPIPVVPGAVYAS